MTAVPRFSLVVPTRARPQQLARCLEAVAEIDYPHERFEVIVVDDGSESPPDEVVDRFSGRPRVVLVKRPGGGPAAARNSGAARAAGELLAFVDDDCAPERGWLREMDRRFDGVSDQAVGGRTVNVLQGNPYSTVSQLVLDGVYRHYNADRDDARFLASNNLVVPSRLFDALGGFDTRFKLAGGEDRDFADRCVRSGIRLVYEHRALVFHAHRLTLRSLWRQHFNYGRGTSTFHRTRLAAARLRPAIEPGLHLTLLRSALTADAGRARWRTAALFFVTQVAYAAGFAAGELEARRSNRNSAAP